MTFNFKEHENELLFVPLGGSNEIGMNLNLYTYKGKWIMIDLGIGFADQSLPGVEVILPDIDFILAHKENLLALVLTHAHEDHLGAVPYLWEELQCPIYATPFTAAVLRAKLADEGIKMKVPVNEITSGQKVTLEPFTFEMIPLTHSIPEMQAIALSTDKGVVMHTGDWKLDPEPVVGVPSDEAMLRQYGDQGVLAMVCDSTNVFVEGESGSEAGVRDSMAEIIGKCKNRVIVTTFASNIARIESIMRAGIAAGRQIALAGRSLRRVTLAAKESGYLQDMPPFLSEHEVANLPKGDVLIICTGCQGEPRAALSKIARGEHPNIKISSGDTVIFSSRKIPGNEQRVAHLYNDLTHRHAEVITAKRHHVHVSGHPARGELARMYEWVRPRIAVPTHGETRHIHEHAIFARAQGVKETVEAKNGSVILLAEGRAMEIGVVPSGYVAVDGTTLIPTTSPVIKMRRKMRDDGCVMVSLGVNRQHKMTIRPRISAPGALDMAQDSDFVAMLIEEIEDRLSGGQKDSIEKIKEAIFTTVRRIFRQEMGKSPVIEVHVLRD